MNVGLFDEEDNFADDFKTPPPPPPPPPKAKRKPKKSTEPVDEPVPSEHKEMFGALCTLVGWDWQVLTGEQSGQVAQALGKLRKADYTIEDLRKFYSHWRNNDWRGKQGSYPTLSQVRAEIGKIKLNNNGNGASVSRRIAEL